MKVYVGQTRGETLIKLLTELGWGEMTSRGELPPRRTPWAYDNGAFPDWTAGRPFNERAFMDDVERIARRSDVRSDATTPDFIVLPDIIAGGERSLEYSLSWISRLSGVAPLYLAVQDGMDVGDVAEVAPSVDGLFVGGTNAWKKRYGQMWVKLAHDCGKPCHLARAGTPLKVRWAVGIGADSLDSCYPLWSEGNLARFIAGLNGEPEPQGWLPSLDFWKGFGVTP